MNGQEDYWDQEILKWEGNSYEDAEPGSASLIEKIAHTFRGPVRYRQVLASQIINALKPKNVLDLGCGSGRFAIRMVTTTGISHVTGVDISRCAIRVAQDRAASMKLTDRLSFVQSSIADLDFEALHQFDFVLGLGLTPYLTAEEFARLFSSIMNTPFLFDVHPKGLSPRNLAHAVYRLIKGHPFYSRYAEEELLSKLTCLGISNVTWRRSKGVYYIRH